MRQTCRHHHPELYVDNPAAKPKSKLSKEPLVYIATAPNEPLVRMWAGILENEGIHSFVKGIDWYLGVSIPYLFPNYEIHVLSSQAEKARKILAPLLKDS